MSVYEVVARNYSAAHENRIHSDEVAREMGFKGALVPGVAVFGHLTYPMAQRFGEDWLGQAQCSVKFLKPAYHDDKLSITTVEDNGRFHIRCQNADGELLATLDASGPEAQSAPEDQSVFAGPHKHSDRPDMTWDTVVVNEPFPQWHLQMTEDGNRTYTEQIADPFEGEYFYYSGAGDDLDNTMTKAFTLAPGSSLTAMVNVQIEVDWDYAYLVVSTDGGANWANVDQSVHEYRSQRPDYPILLRWHSGVRYAYLFGRRLGQSANVHVQRLFRYVIHRAPVLRSTG